jgi:hypothetical protein
MLSSEAEYVLLAEAAKEVKCVVMALINMGVPVQMPVIVRVGNIRAMYTLENYMTSSRRTKHIDMRYHFVRKFVKEEFIKIVFVGTKHNDPDGFTNNLMESTICIQGSLCQTWEMLWHNALRNRKGVRMMCILSIILCLFKRPLNGIANMIHQDWSKSFDSIPTHAHRKDKDRRIG